MSIGDKINTNQSVLGQDILDWIAAPKEEKTDLEQIISSKLYYKYIVDREGRRREDTKIYPNVYYYVNYNNHFNESIWLAYIVRDKVRSPRHIPDSLAFLNIVDSRESYKGSTIQEWAYYQNGSASREYYMEGCEIVTKYLEVPYSLRTDVYYYITRTSKGIKVFRDIERSPRTHEFYPSNEAEVADV